MENERWSLCGSSGKNIVRQKDCPSARSGFANNKAAKARRSQARLDAVVSDSSQSELACFFCRKKIEKKFNIMCLCGLFGIPLRPL